MTDEAHYDIGPSGWDRWSRCPGSVALSKQVNVVEGPSDYRDEGIQAHANAAVMLKGGQAPVMPDEMAQALGRYAQCVQLAGEIIGVELQLDLASVYGEPGAFGTLDAATISSLDPKVLQIHDLKYGKGVAVAAENNGQLMIYALGALAELDPLGEFEAVELWIHQPRLLAEPSIWQISAKDLRAWAEEELRPAVREVRQYSDKLYASTEACRWCKAKAICPAQADLVQAVVFDPVDGHVQEVNAVPIPQIAREWGSLDLIEDWIKARREYVHNLLAQGIPVGDLYLGEGRKGNRKWADERAAFETLVMFGAAKEDITKMTLLTPAQVTKALPKDLTAAIEDLVVQEPGKPVVCTPTSGKPRLTPAQFEDMR